MGELGGDLQGLQVCGVGLALGPPSTGIPSAGLRASSSREIGSQRGRKKGRGCGRKGRGEGEVAWDPGPGLWEVQTAHTNKQMDHTPLGHSEIL